MKVFSLLVLLCLSSAMNFETFEPEPYQNFFKGLLLGLGSGSTQCEKDSNILSHEFGILYQDILNAETNSYLPIISDLVNIKSDLDKAEVSCDLNGLTKKIAKLLGPSGKATIMRNYAFHSGEINADLKKIEHCAENIYDCGQSAGSIFKLMVGWSLHSTLEEGIESEIDLTSGNIVDLFEGIFNTVEWDAPDFCKDMFNMMPKAKDVANQIVGMLSGKTQDAQEFIKSAINLWTEEAVISDCALHYGGMLMYVIPNIASNDHIWRLAYYAETQNFMSYVNYITTSCVKNYGKCGVTMGNMINLLLKYTNSL
ncbi:hypothetical protein SteCoe_30543 [Stentor coeruleus]|uniref:Uncharacterized protein n=1 Tax=Stentor coeruleus TaxID=5963 RepID=A0A1R2B3E8_9CILI|nr:hypothetical protein SteCoe_30543 [Stentor coeruleus]